MTEECKQDKALFIAKIKAIGQATKSQVLEREAFETSIDQIWKLTRD